MADPVTVGSSNRWGGGVDRRRRNVRKLPHCGGAA
ncbi:uncharacterized protein METZ01_LOCUS6567 [marine metagenome]|uniref:Uncharacterized protein n=1 Tax=marine metagenome TaxID=408172 RepID=A0A381NJM1_9ZZZZ